MSSKDIRFVTDLRGIGTTRDRVEGVTLVDWAPPELICCAPCVVCGEYEREIISVYGGRSQM